MRSGDLDAVQVRRVQPGDSRQDRSDEAFAVHHAAEQGADENESLEHSRHNHSARSATTGSTCAAFRAGTMHATAATSPSKAAAAANDGPSVGLTL
jgi:hypothetical protein